MNFFSIRRTVLYSLPISTLLLLTSCSDKQPPPPPPPSVIVTTVSSDEVTESMNIVGQVAAKENVYLQARVKGFLTKRNFAEGSFVKKGQLLYEIEKGLYQAQVEAAQAELDEANAQLNNAMIDYNRQKTLVQKSAVSVQVFDIAATLKASTEANVLGAKAKLKEAQLNLSYTDIYAPFGGRIGVSTYSVGNLVGPESNPLAQVVMIDPIRVEFNLAESLILTILQETFSGNKLPNKNSKKVILKSVIPKLILANGTKYKYAGQINFVNNIINPLTGTILMRALFSNPKALLIPGSYVKVSLQNDVKTKAMLIPQSSIQEDQAGKFVMALNKDNEVVQKSITTGAIFGANIVVNKGLKVGEIIIVEGLQKVRTGLKVKPTTQEKTSTPDKTEDSKKTTASNKTDKNKTQEQ